MDVVFTQNNSVDLNFKLSTDLTNQLSQSRRPLQHLISKFCHQYKWYSKNILYTGHFCNPFRQIKQLLAESHSPGKRGLKPLFGRIKIIKHLYLTLKNYFNHKKYSILIKKVKFYNLVKFNYIDPIYYFRLTRKPIVKNYMPYLHLFIILNKNNLFMTQKRSKECTELRHKTRQSI